MNLFKETEQPTEVFDRLILQEKYAEAFAYAIDNGIEREALKICIEYVQADDEKPIEECNTVGVSEKPSTMFESDTETFKFIDEVTGQIFEWKDNMWFECIDDFWCVVDK